MVGGVSCVSRFANVVATSGSVVGTSDAVNTYHRDRGGSESLSKDWSC